MNKKIIILGIMMMLITIASVSAEIVDDFTHEDITTINGYTNNQGYSYLNSGEGPCGITNNVMWCGTGGPATHAGMDYSLGQTFSVDLMMDGGDSGFFQVVDSENTITIDISYDSETAIQTLSYNINGATGPIGTVASGVWSTISISSTTEGIYTLTVNGQEIATSGTMTALTTYQIFGTYDPDKIWVDNIEINDAETSIECDSSLSISPCNVTTGNDLTINPGNYVNKEIHIISDGATTKLLIPDNTSFEGDIYFDGITANTGFLQLMPDSPNITFNANFYRTGLSTPYFYVGLANAQQWNVNFDGSEYLLWLEEDRYRDGFDPAINRRMNQIYSLNYLFQRVNITGTLTNNDFSFDRLSMTTSLPTVGLYFDNVSGVDLNNLGIYLDGILQTKGETYHFENNNSEPTYYWYGQNDNETLSMAPNASVATGIEFYVNTAGTWSVATIKEDNPSSSSSSSANYAVDEEGNIIGIVANGQLITSNGKTTTTTTSPTLSLTGNQAGPFNIGEAIRNLWNNIKGWLIK